MSGIEPSCVIKRIAVSPLAGLGKIFFHLHRTLRPTVRRLDAANISLLDRDRYVDCQVSTPVVFKAPAAIRLGAGFPFLARSWRVRVN